jgi:ion channel-forming bestrophin family protein
MIEYQITNWWKTTLAFKGTTLPNIILRVAILPIMSIFLLLFAKEWVVEVKLNVVGHSILGSAMGFLLVFRNNASYDRFWEGRKRWGGIVNDSRNLARSIHAYGGDLNQFAPLLCSFCHALKHQLRYLSAKEIEQDIKNFVDQDQYSKWLKHPNISWMITVDMSHNLQEESKQGRITWEQSQRIESLITSLINHQGACERILKTPVPFSHTVHVRQLLMFYLLSLPLVLIPIMGWLSLVGVTIIGFGLLGIEEAGAEIEDPFGTDPNDLPIEKICETICNDIMKLVDLNKMSK